MTGAARILLASGVVAASVAAPSQAHAQDLRRPAFYERHHAYESPQHFAVELRVSPFYPTIDHDPALVGRTPFANAFGTSNTIMFGGEFDWQAIRIPHVGNVGPGLGIAYASFSGQAQVASATAGSSTASGETTTLEIYPFYLVAVLRADALWKELRVPVVPYAKLGFATSLWRASNTLGTSSYHGQSGKGYSVGTQLALGVSLNLNMFDPYAAKNFDQTMGVNSTSLFAEWTDANVNGLWLQQDPLRVGGSYWTLGLAWEF